MHTFPVITGQLRVQKILYANKHETHFFIDAVKSRHVASKGCGVLRGHGFYRSQSLFNGVNAFVLRIVRGFCLLMYLWMMSSTLSIVMAAAHRLPRTPSTHSKASFRSFALPETGQTLLCNDFA